MEIKKATRSRCSSRAPMGSGRTEIIVAQCAVFVCALMAVPTIMAATKAMGVW